jgi:hypothetical protein
MTSPQKGPVRKAIERVLARAEKPLSRAEICERSGQTSEAVGVALWAMMDAGDCYSDNKRPTARYTAEPQTAPVPKLPTPRAFNYQTAPLYVPHELRPFEGRPGAMDAHRLPSLINGVRVTR